MSSLPPGSSVVIQVKTFRSHVKVPLRLRLWYRWQMLRHRKAMLMREDFFRELEYNTLFGPRQLLEDRLAPYTHWEYPELLNGWRNA